MQQIPRSAPAHQRVNGETRLRLRTGNDGTAEIADLYQRAPCRILMPRPEPDDLTQAVLLTTCGGFTGGDRASISADFGSGARAVITTQAAERIYRALDATDDVLVDLQLRAADSAWAEWLPQETILFDGSRLRRSLCAHLERGSRLLAVESVVLGRGAMRENFSTGRLHESWKIYRAGRLIWADALRLDGDVAALRANPFALGPGNAIATVVYAAEDAALHLGTARRLLESATCATAATLLEGVLIVRVLAHDPREMRATLMNLLPGLRHAVAGLPCRLPQVWYC